MINFMIRPSTQVTFTKRLLIMVSTEIVFFDRTSGGIYFFSFKS